MTDFDGSAGDVAVAGEDVGAFLWTDGRYYLQAEKQLDGAVVELMRAGQPGVPSMEKHLTSVLASGARVGVDPCLISISQAKRIGGALGKADMELVSVEENLVDLVRADAGQSVAQPSGSSFCYFGCPLP